MARLGRLAAAIILVFGAAIIAPTVAHAGCAADPTAPGCLPTPQPGTPAPKPTPKPTTAPTAAPTKAPTPAPTHHVVHTGGTGTGTTSTVAPSPFNIEVPNTKANATPQILVDPLNNNNSLLDVPSGTQAASASSWIFGFIVGLIVGGLIGRASWGLRKRRRQQIFG